MSLLSRRHVVASAAALPALTIPEIANGPNPDAKLLRLGVELEAIAIEWHAQRAFDEADTALRDAACEAAGLPDIEHGTIPDDEWRAYQDKRSVIRRAVKGTNPDEDATFDVWDDIHGRMWPLIDDILERKAQTLAGFVVQVRAVSLSHAELWDGDADEGEHYRPFIETACAFAGVVPVPCDGAPIVAVVREPDPIFALIDRARAATEAHGHACKAEPVLADGHTALGTPAYVAWQEANEATCDASWEALNDLLATPPTTRAGMAAVVRYVSEIPGNEIGKANYCALLDSLNAHFAA